MSSSTQHQTDATSTDVERQREAIADTRADMGHTLGHLEGRVSPTRIRARQKARLRFRWERTKHAVMGSESDDHAVGDRVIDVTDRARDATQQTEQQLSD